MDGKDIKLKDCPFCGSNCINDTDLAVRTCDGDVVHWLCVCPDCIVKQLPQDTEEDAIKAWNTRTERAL